MKNITWRQTIIANIKYFFQKLIRGYSDVDVWGACDYIAVKALPIVKAYRRMKKSGVPINKSGNILSEREWNTILDKIIIALQSRKKDKKPENQSWTDYFNAVEEGEELFREYFWHLWD